MARLTNIRRRREWAGNLSDDTVETPSDEESMGYKVLVKIVEHQWDDFDKKTRGPGRSASDASVSHSSEEEKSSSLGRDEV